MTETAVNSANPRSLLLALRRIRPYGHTLFSKPRFRTEDGDKARRSMFVYAHDGDIWGAELDGWWSTSLMGIANGLIRWTGFRFGFAVTGADANGGRYILRTELRR